MLCVFAVGLPSPASHGAGEARERRMGVAERAAAHGAAHGAARGAAAICLVQAEDRPLLRDRSTSTPIRCVRE